MIALVTDTDLVCVPVRLFAVLEQQVTPKPPSSAVQLAAELTDDSDCLSTVHVAFATHLDPL